MLSGAFLNTVALCKCVTLVEERFKSLCSEGMQTDRYIYKQEKDDMGSPSGVNKMLFM